MGKNIIILGASWAGVPLAHHLLKHTVPLVPGLKVILVSPNSALYCNIAVVRGLLPDTFTDDQMFLPIKPAFEKYPASHFEFVLGAAQSIDPAKNTVTVGIQGGKTQTLSYDQLVIATGSSFRGNLPFKGLGSTEDTKAALHAWQEKVEAAKSIIVAGGGATGVELAGELGYAYARTGQKQITLVTSDPLPLYSRLTDDVRQTAKSKLEALKVRLVSGATVGKIAEASKGPAKIELERASGDRETLTADLFIPTYGVQPNSAFVPSDMLDSKGFVKQNKFLQTERYPNIFAIGDVGNLNPTQILYADNQVQLLAKSLNAYLAGGELLEYTWDDKPVMGITVGPKGGTGQAGTWKIWSIIIWYMKARYIGTNYAGDILDGKRTVQAKTWA
jgi:apoptosis-inducing factor 2